MGKILGGDDLLDDAIFKGVFASRQLAKRQLTWLEGGDDLMYFGQFCPKDSFWRGPLNYI